MYEDHLRTIWIWKRVSAGRWEYFTIQLPKASKWAVAMNEICLQIVMSVLLRRNGWCIRTLCDDFNIE